MQSTKGTDMGTKSYVVSIPSNTTNTSVSTNVEKLQERLQALLESIDEAGETVVTVQAVDAGWGATFSNNIYSHGLQGVPMSSVYGAALGFSYTDALIVITRTS
jgi:hypothetical protein